LRFGATQVGRDFLPRGKEICTRRPLILQLVQQVWNPARLHLTHLIRAFMRTASDLATLSRAVRACVSNGRVKPTLRSLVVVFPIAKYSIPSL